MFDTEAKIIMKVEHKDVNVGSIWQFVPAKDFFPNKNPTEPQLFLITEINSKDSYTYEIGQTTKIIIPKVIAINLNTKKFRHISLLEHPELWRKVI